MKIKIDVEIECSPEELRASWNLPDLARMQEEFVEALARQIRDPSAAWPIEAWVNFWRGAASSPGTLSPRPSPALPLPAKEGAAGPTNGSRNGH
jgi:hypothetical protein